MRFLKGAIIFIAGVGIGAAGSFIFFKKKYETEKADLDELKEHYSNKMQHEADVKTFEKIIEDQGYISYDNLREEGVKAVIRNVEAEAVVVDSPPEDYPSEPIIINASDYNERELYFDKLEFDYYLGDGALVDENEELVEVGDVIGYENLEEFINDESEDTLYLRNASQSADYMIRKVSGSFSEVVGIGGDDD